MDGERERDSKKESESDSSTETDTYAQLEGHKKRIRWWGKGGDGRM